ncbi:MAG: 2-oxoacid:acceptor oxidoreductase family protein [Ignavibacteriales bacterium]|nr:2-oxoacid:acceptor oxidoreductase family protein [Ignavibacteriales bacterium]
MVEIRFHGRGGQGTVVASKILADAIAKEDKWVQAYPEFGVERRGSPVVAFIRIDDKQIYDKSRIYTPDQRRRRRPDPGRGHRHHRGPQAGRDDHHQQRPPARGLPASTASSRSGRSTPPRSPSRTSWAAMAAPIVNTAIAGAVVKILGLAKFESLAAAIRDGVPIKPEDNVKAAQEAYETA